MHLQSFVIEFFDWIEEEIWIIVVIKLRSYNNLSN